MRKGERNRKRRRRTCPRIPWPLRCRRPTRWPSRSWPNSPRPTAVPDLLERGPYPWSKACSRDRSSRRSRHRTASLRGQAACPRQPALPLCRRLCRRGAGPCFMVPAYSSILLCVEVSGLWVQVLKICCTICTAGKEHTTSSRSAAVYIT